MIPKILHQIWVGDNEILPEYAHYHTNWKALHPDWGYKLWRDEDIVGTPIQEMVSAAPAFPSKADIIRIYAVLIYGGVYADVDFDWNKNLEPFLIFNAFSVKEKPDRYNNAFFGAIPSHPWVKWQYDNLPIYASKKPPWGPDLATKSMKHAGWDVATLPTSYFYPYLWGKRRRPASDFPDAYAVHHWALTWRKSKQKLPISNSESSKGKSPPEEEPGKIDDSKTNKTKKGNGPKRKRWRRQWRRKQKQRRRRRRKR